MTATITFYSIILCQAQGSVPYMNLSFNPCRNPTSGAPELCLYQESEETLYEKSNSFSGILEARGRGEDSVRERAVQKWQGVVLKKIFFNVSRFFYTLYQTWFLFLRSYLFDRERERTQAGAGEGEAGSRRSREPDGARSQGPRIMT